MAPPCQASNRNGTATPGVPHGDNCEVQCGSAVRKKASFTHGRDNLRGDVSGKRFSTHARERNEERIGVGRCGNDKGMGSELGFRCAIGQVGVVGLGHRARQEFARGRSRWCGGAGAWHITARLRMDMALRHLGSTWR